MEGGCQCGAVRYRLLSGIRAGYLCHCAECKKQSAGAFGITLPVRREQLDIVGAMGTYRRPAASGAQTVCYFCPRCGTRLYHCDEHSRGVVSLKAGSLDRPEAISIVAELWTCRKLPWVKTGSGIERFDTQPAELQDWRAALAGADHDRPRRSGVGGREEFE